MCRPQQQAANTSAHTQCVHVLRCFTAVHVALIVLFYIAAVASVFETLIVCRWLVPVVVIVAGVVMRVFVLELARVAVSNLCAEVDVFLSSVPCSGHSVLAKHEEL